MMRLVSTILKLAGVLFIWMFFPPSHAENFGEVRIVPLSFETLYPYTREIFWSVGCQQFLDADQAKEWDLILLKFAPDQSHRFQDSNVRVGLKAGALAYYMDRDLVLLNPAGEQFFPRGAAEDADIRAFIHQQWMSCRKNRATAAATGAR